MIGRDKSSDYENFSSPLLNIRSSGIRAVGIGDVMAVRARCLFSYIQIETSQLFIVECELI